MTSLQTKTLPRAFEWIASALFAAVICAALFVAVVVTQKSDEAQQQLRHDIVLRGADAVGLSFNTALKREWRSLNAVAQNISGSSKADVDDFMDAVAETGGQIAWSGVADLEGRISSGSNRLREGEDVSERRWFREGLRQPNVGNVHVRTSVAAADDGENRSLLNLSAPIIDPATREVTGVLVYSLRMAWVEAFLRNARERLNIDLVVQNRAGQTLVDTRETARDLPEAVVAQAALGQDLAGTFRLLDQADGLYAFSPNFVSDDLPDFGWRVFAVLDTSQVVNVMPELLRVSVIAVTLAALFVLLVTLVVARVVLRPVEELAKTAEAMVDGDFEFPLESRSSHEARSLSRSLARLQGSLALHRLLIENRDAPPLQVLLGGADGVRGGTDRASDQAGHEDDRQTRQARRKS